jgi:predicted metalloendopeptidase
LHPWWSNATSEKFDERVGCVVQTYSNFTVQAGNETLHVNGNLTLGENLGAFVHVCVCVV